MRIGRGGPPDPTDRTPAAYDRDAVPDPSPPRAPAPRPATVRSIARRRRSPPQPDRALEAILDTVVEAIIVFDPASWLISDVNRSACDVTAPRPRTSSSDRASMASSPAPRPRGLARSSRQSSPATQDVSTAMMDIQRPDGGTTTVEMVIQPIASPDGGSAIVAIARDIGERIEVQVRLQRLAQAEHARAAELNAVIRAMGEAVVVCAADGTITLTNPAGEQLFPDVEEQTYRRHPRPAARPGRLRAARSACPAARSSCRPATIPIAGSSSRPTRSPSASASRPPATRRSWSCATSPRPAAARPSARRSSASCRTSSGRR